MAFSHIQARATNRNSVYGKEWETCEGTETLSYSDALSLTRNWNQQEKEDHGQVVSMYRYVNCDLTSTILPVVH